MQLPAFDPQFRPAFHVGQKAWILVDNEVDAVDVNGINLEVCDGVTRCVGYVLSRYKFTKDDMTTSYGRDEVYADERSAAAGGPALSPVLTDLPLPPLYNREELPNLEHGRDVWYIRGRKVQSAKTEAALFVVCGAPPGHPKYSAGNYGLVFRGYRLELRPDKTEVFRPFEVYDAKEAADADAVWYSAESVQADEWMRAIGTPRFKEGVLKRKPSLTVSSEQSELGTCCANISEIRDLLMRCWRDGGLISRERDNLEYQLTHHHEYPSSPEGGRPKNLDRILAVIGIRIGDPPPTSEKKTATKRPN